MVHRFENNPVYIPTHARTVLAWDLPGLWGHALEGLTLVAELAKQHEWDLISIGVDSWAVDFGFLDSQGNLTEPVRHYRDSGTNDVVSKLLSGLGAKTIYERTGIQFLQFNTLVQMLARKLERVAPPVAANRVRMLMVPDLFHFWLCGSRVTERTNASTTQMVSIETGQWDAILCAAAGITPSLLPAIVNPGTTLGKIRPEIAEITGLPSDLNVVAVATHDTASAVVAAPVDRGEEPDDWAFLSSGTWSLIGVELPCPVVSDEGLVANFTNEAGYKGTTRFLKNVAGLWILQECRRAWDVSFDELYAAAEEAGDSPKRFDVDNPAFLAPGTDMPDRIVQVAGLGAYLASKSEPEKRGILVRCLLESLAQKYAENLETITRLTGRPIRRLVIMGGGSRINLLNKLTEEETGCQVIVGPADASILGNLLVQMDAYTENVSQ
jgi:rhamnulokinase